MSTTDLPRAVPSVDRTVRPAALPDGRGQAWIDAFDDWPTPLFPRTIGARLQEVRGDYARMTLPYAPTLDQPAGFIHGGVIATLLDTVVVPAIGSAYERPPALLTIDLQIRYLDAARQVDLVAEGWVTKRGSTIAFCESEVATAAGATVAQAWLTYRILGSSRPGPTDDRVTGGAVTSEDGPR